jgi:signal peptidase I
MVVRRVWEALGWRPSPLVASVARRLITFATWVPVAIFFNNNVATPVAIRGNSMYPFFNSERDQTTRRDWALCWKGWGSPQYGLRPGMIVVFRWGIACF